MDESYVIDYCNKHNLSAEKLKKQKFDVIDDVMIFAQPTGVKPNGLINDIATRPYPTLIIRLDKDGSITIEKTQYTDKYLAK